LRDGVDIHLDAEGQEVNSLEELPAIPMEQARSIICEGARVGLITLDRRIDVEDESKTIVHSLEFTDAVAIVWRLEVK